jgi:hypothetical protein
MAITQYVLDASSVNGPPFGPTDGYITQFTQLSPPTIVLGGPGFGRTRSVFQAGLLR